MTPTSNRKKLTCDDLASLPDDGLRHELINGKHYVSPSPRLEHQVIASNLHLILSTHVRERALGVVLFAPFDVVLSRYDLVVPDLVYFRSERFKETVNELNAQGPPDLAVEILSPRTRRRDESLKRVLYERSGVEEYWIVDPARGVITVLRRTNGRYETVILVSNDGKAALTTPLLPDLTIPLASVFELP